MADQTPQPLDAVGGSSPRASTCRELLAVFLGFIPMAAGGFGGLGLMWLALQGLSFLRGPYSSPGEALWKTLVMGGVSVPVFFVSYILIAVACVVLLERGPLAGLWRWSKCRPEIPSEDPSESKSS